MDLFSAGQKISLNFQKDSNMVEMVCSVEKVYDDRLVLLLPQYFMRYVDSLQEGNTVTAKAFSKLGTIDFNTMIISSPLEESFEIELDYNALKLTDGEEIPVVNAMEKLEIKTSKEVMLVKTFELSTEYVKFYSEKPLGVGDSFDFTMLLPKEYGIIKFKGTISEVDPIYDNEFTVVYTTMTENDRQTLLYYMYMYTNNNSD